MADKVPAVKKTPIKKAPVVKTHKDLPLEHRLEIVEKYLAKALGILASHFGVILEDALKAEIAEALKSVGPKR